MIKKFTLFICALSFMFISSFSSVFATDDELYYGSFFGEEHMIVPQIPNISFFSNLDGYLVSYYIFNYEIDSGWIQYYDTVEVPNYKALTYYEDIQFPRPIEAGTSFDFSLSVMASTIEDNISDFYRIAFYDKNETFLTQYNEASSNVIVSYNAMCDEANVYVRNVELSSDCVGVRVFHRVQSNTDLEGGAYVRNVGCTAFSQTNMITDIFKGITQLPGKIADSISKFFELEDDTVVNENESANDDLKDNIEQYDQIESTLVDGFNTNIGSLDTSIDMFNVADFHNTSLFLSQQMTSLFNLNENVRNMVMYSLIMGFAFVLVGIGIKR